MFCGWTMNGENCITIDNQAVFSVIISLLLLFFVYTTQVWNINFMDFIRKRITTKKFT